MSVFWQGDAPQGGADPELQAVLAGELADQARTINLTAAANRVSPAVRAAMDPRLGNIHCEGYPRRRYHEGQTGADAIEALAIRRARTAFGADHANVQPYRGTMANLAAAMAVLSPGDTLLGLEPRAGGHYSTGGALHLIGRLFRVVPYELDAATDRLDYDAIAALAERERPRAIFCGDTAYPRHWDWARLAAIARAVGAVLIADISQLAGLIAAGAAPSPIPHVGIATAATYKTLKGPRAGLILCRAEHATAVDRAVYPICQGGPNVMLLAGLAAALGECATPAFAAEARAVLRNAARLAERLRAAGFTLTTGGTDTHACLIDLRDRNIPGHHAARALAAANLICNGNQLPRDPAPPMRPSGLRLGTPVVTALGMREAEMDRIADFVATAFERFGDDRALAALGREVTAFRSGFPEADAAGRIVYREPVAA